MIFNSEQLGNNISRNTMGRRMTQKLGKLFAAGVIPAYNSANLQDYRGLSGYLDMWKGAIDDGVTGSASSSGTTTTRTRP